MTKLPNEDDFIDDVEIVDDGEIIDDVQIVHDPIVVDDFRHQKPSYGQEAFEDDEPETVKAPAGFGIALGMMCLMVGGIGMLMGWDYTIRRVPAPIFGGMAFVLGIFVLIFRRSRWIQGAFDNMRR